MKSAEAGEQRRVDGRGSRESDRPAGAGFLCAGGSCERDAGGVRSGGDCGVRCGCTPRLRGWIWAGASGLSGKSGTATEALRTGAPAVSSGQVRTGVEATVALELASWGKLQMALTCGVQQMNVLAGPATSGAGSAAANGSGGAPSAALALGAGSTASALVVDGLAVGDVVAVDVDYAGSTGFVGSGASGGYVKNAAAIGGRRGLRAAGFAERGGAWWRWRDGVATLAGPLLAGAPAAGMKVSKVVAFCDREGGSFFAEWSGLFVLDGEGGDRVVFHYPSAAGDGGRGGNGGDADRAAGTASAAGAISCVAGAGWETMGSWWFAFGATCRRRCGAV